MPLNLILAIDNKNGIGKNNKLPWSVPEDLQYFKNTTLNTTVVMGRYTFDSLNNKPLPNRKNLVVTSSFNNIINNKDYHEDDIHFLDIYSLRNYIHQKRKNETIFIIGGENMYKEFINDCDYIFMTKIYDDFSCDKFFEFNQDSFTTEWSSDIFSSKNNIKFQYFKLKNANKT